MIEPKENSTGPLTFSTNTRTTMENTNESSGFSVSTKQLCNNLFNSLQGLQATEKSNHNNSLQGLQANVQSNSNNSLQSLQEYKNVHHGNTQQGYYNLNNGYSLHGQQKYNNSKISNS